MSAESNRQQMPVIAKFVDELRAQGFSVKVLYAKENGVEKGKKPIYDWHIQASKEKRS
jgi:hypothetical protein